LTGTPKRLFYAQQAQTYYEDRPFFGAPRARIHSYRTSRRHRHHRHSRWDAFTGAFQGQGKGAANGLPQQRETDHAGLHALRARQRRQHAKLRLQGLLMLYAPDNDDNMPNCASKGSFAVAKEDWIFFNVQRNGDPFFENPQNSAIGKYIGRFDTNLFRCPGDKFARQREIQWYKDRSGNPYFYSYSVISLEVGGVNHGMTSILAGAGNNRYFKFSNVKNPVEKLFVVEENNDPSLAVADDGRCVPATDYTGNVLSGRHGIGRIPGNATANWLDTVYSRKGKATVSFADGHVDMVSPRFGFSPEHHDPLY
jgi:prepilin-type processing-associated H-X9-DG protein